MLCKQPGCVFRNVFVGSLINGGLRKPVLLQKRTLSPLDMTGIPCRFERSIKRVSLLIHSALLSVNSNVAGAGSSAAVAFLDSPNMAPALEGAHLLALPWLTVNGALLHTCALFSAYTHGIACNGAIASYAIICRLVDKVKIRHSAPSEFVIRKNNRG